MVTKAARGLSLLLQLQARSDLVGRWTHRNARWLFITPAAIVVGTIIVYPVLYTSWMSMHEWHGSGLSAPNFTGLANFQRILLRDFRFHQAFIRTFYFTGLAVAVETAFGLAAALVFSQEFRGRGLLRTLAILPMIATPTAVALVFTMMFHPLLGVANYLLSIMGLARLEWTYSKETALYTLVLVDAWQWTPLIMLILLAGLASLPPEPYEAALIDGASWLRTFWHITLPLLRPAIVVAVLFRAIDALKTFDIIFVMTQGGPGYATETLNLLLFTQAFSYLDMGYASAVAVALFIIVMSVSLLLIKARRTATW